MNKKRGRQEILSGGWKALPGKGVERGVWDVLRDQFVVHFGSRVRFTLSSTETASHTLNTRGRSRHLQPSLLFLHIMCCVCATYYLYQMLMSKASSHFEIPLLGDKILSLD